MAENNPNTKIGDDLPEKALGLIDLVVDTINDRIIRPIILVGRAVVFGLLIAAVVSVVAVVVAVATLRLLDVYVFGGAVWASYTVLGIVFLVAGLVIWTMRNASSSDEGDGTQGAT